MNAKKELSALEKLDNMILNGFTPRIICEPAMSDGEDRQYTFCMPIGYNDVHSYNLDTLISNAHRFLKEQEII